MQPSSFWLFVSHLPAGVVAFSPQRLRHLPSAISHQSSSISPPPPVLSACEGETLACGSETMPHATPMDFTGPPSLRFQVSSFIPIFPTLSPQVCPRLKPHAISGFAYGSAFPSSIRHPSSWPVELKLLHQAHPYLPHAPARRATQPGNSSPACGGKSGARSSTFQPSPVAFLARASR